MRILQQVLEMNHALRAETTVRPNPGMLNEALRRTLQLAPHDCLVVIISDGEGMDEQTKELLTRIAQHNDVVSAFVFDPLEADLPDLSRVVISDGHGQLDVNTSDTTLRNRFRTDFAALRERGRHFLLTREVPVLPISTAEPTHEQLAQLLGRQSRRASR
jgi:hypothetical protein